MWEATERLAAIAEKSSEHIPAIERARLFVEIIQRAEITASGDNMISITATAQIYNEGKTPAILIDTFVGMRPLLGYPKGMDGYMKKIETDSGAKYIRTGIRESITRTCTITNITQELTGIQNGLYKVLYYGRIRYEDVIGDEWERWFCYECAPSRAISDWPFRMSPEGNYEKKYEEQQEEGSPTDTT
jgi:hypothetical protein